MSDYLKGAATTASVPGIRLVCRQLLSAGPSTTSGLAAVLRPDDFMKGDGEGAALPGSLEVAADLRLVAKSGSGRDSVWDAGPVLMAAKDPFGAAESSSAFRSLVAQALNDRVRECLRDKQQPSDVAKGLVWLLGRDPLAGMTWDGAEPELVASGLKAAKVIENLTQWRPFWRWCVALGYGHQLGLGGKRVLSISAVQAIRHFVSRTHGTVPASQFLDNLLEAVPVLGHPALVNTLPDKARPQGQGTATRLIADGLYRLEAAKLVNLLPGDDSENVLQLAPSDGESRVIRSVEWIGVAE